MYGDKKQQQEFIVKYEINYPSGKKFTTKLYCYAYSELGAIDTVKWLRKGKDISIISVETTGKRVGAYIYPTNHVLGER